ncbi:MAG: hypothetical protein ALAOOOJD_03902 [bacterium]|nr:hypothetical protein [bacterium]
MENTPGLQRRVDSLLKWGIVFSILWLAGIGSLCSFVLAMKARNMIKQSNGAVIGMGKVRWCLIVGGIGMLIWFPIVVIGIINNL